MKRWVAVWLVAFVFAGPADALGQQNLASTTTMAEWYGWAPEIRIPWVGGAMGAFALLGARCDAAPSVGSVVDAMTQRYLAGTFKGADRALTRILVIMSDHDCAFDSEEMLSSVNAAMKARRSLPGTP